MKLNGEISLIGDSQEDELRLIHLKNLCKLVNDLVIEIDNIAYDNKNSWEFSKKNSGEYAYKFLNNTLGIKEEF